MASVKVGMLLCAEDLNQRTHMLMKGCRKSHPKATAETGKAIHSVNFCKLPCHVFGDMSFYGHYTHPVDVLCVFKGCLYLVRCAPAKDSWLCNSSYEQDVVGSTGLSRKSVTSLHSLWHGSSTERDKEFLKYHWIEHEILFELYNTGRECVNSVIE